MGVHASNVSNRNQAKKLHMAHSLDKMSCRQYQQWELSKRATHDSQTGGEFIQAMSVTEIKQKSFT
jgi:hypothetical protein